MTSGPLRVDCASCDHPSAETIDRIARLQLEAQRWGVELHLVNARPALVELIDFCGLAEFLRVEVEGQAE